MRRSKLYFLREKSARVARQKMRKVKDIIGSGLAFDADVDTPADDVKADEKDGDALDTVLEDAPKDIRVEKEEEKPKTDEVKEEEKAEEKEEQKEGEVKEEEQEEKEDGQEKKEEEVKEVSESKESTDSKEEPKEETKETEGNK